MSRGASDRCWSISLERTVPETSKLVSILLVASVTYRLQAIIHTGFKIKRSKSSSISAETKSISYLPKGRLRNFRTGTPIEHALYQLPRPAIKAYEDGFLQAGACIPCRPHPAATQLVTDVIVGASINQWNRRMEADFTLPSAFTSLGPYFHSFSLSVLTNTSLTQEMA